MQSISQPIQYYKMKSKKNKLKQLKDQKQKKKTYPIGG
jgi:hypothetical protein